MALAGSLLGAAAGVLFQQALPGLLSDCCRWTSRPRSRGAPSRSASGWGSGWPRCSRSFRCSRSGGCRRSPRCDGTYETELAPRDPWRWLRGAGAGSQHGRTRRRFRWAAGGRAPSSPEASAVALLVLWVASWALVRAARRWLPGGLALPLAPGPLQPAPPVQSDRHRGARHRLRRLPAGDADPGPAQPAPTSCGSPVGRPGPTWSCSTSSPTSCPTVERSLREAGLSAVGPGADRADAHRVGEGASGPASMLADTPAARQSAALGPAAGVPLDLSRLAGELRTTRSPGPGGHLARRAVTVATGTGSRWRAGSRSELGVGVGDEIVWDVQGVADARPGWRACARWTGRGSSPTSSSCSSPARWRVRRRRW